MRAILAVVGILVLLTSLASCSILELFQGSAIQVVQSEKPRVSSPDVAAADEARLVTGNTDFAWSLYDAVVEANQNLFYSPYSISMAMAMTYAGAKALTERQMGETLHFTLPQAILHAAFNALDLELARRGQATKQSKGFQLKTANSLWGQTGYSFLASFLDVLAENYGAGLKLLDFQKAAEASRTLINDWVSQQTAGKIEDLLPPGSIGTDTKLVLTNAIYFKAAWLSPFDKKLTHDGAFHLLDGNPVTVPMMEQATALRYGEGQGYQAVELPYEGEQLSMVILMPELAQFASFESSLDAEKVNEILSNMATKLVHITMPKFGFKSRFSLKDALIRMGMADAFTDHADFSGMTGGTDLKIGDAFHSAWVTVNEAGTEAAAATAVIMVPTAAPSPAEIKIDHPFLFLIRDMETGAILFVGRLINPT